MARRLRRKGACCAGQDIRDAARVAERLGIPHYVLDYESRFRAEVIEDFADATAAARRRCRASAATSGSSFAICLPPRAISALRRWRPGIMSAGWPAPTDPSCIAPATPPATRAISYLRRRAPNSISCAFRWAGWPRTRPARWPAHFGLAVADKPDSQDICFVPQGSYAELVERLRPEAGEPGDIVDERGRVLGRHRGIAHFTVGQRKGLGIAAAEPLYVLRDRARAAAHRRRPAGGAGRSPDFARRAELAGSAAPQPIGRQGCGQAALGADAGAGDALSRRLRLAKPSWFSTPRPMRSRRARPRFSTMASGCWAAAGSAAGPRLDRQHPISYMRRRAAG